MDQGRTEPSGKNLAIVSDEANTMVSSTNLVLPLPSHYAMQLLENNVIRQQVEAAALWNVGADD